MYIVNAEFVNSTEGYRYGNEVWDAYVSQRSKLFKKLQREYGRCTGKMYIDTKSGETKVIGWVFEKKVQYTDARNNNPNSFYVRESWVEIREVN